jgi:hypothetical protein
MCQPLLPNVGLTINLVAHPSDKMQAQCSLLPDPTTTVSSSQVGFIYYNSQQTVFNSNSTFTTNQRDSLSLFYFRSDVTMHYNGIKYLWIDLFCHCYKATGTSDAHVSVEASLLPIELIPVLSDEAAAKAFFDLLRKAAQTARALHPTYQPSGI